MHRITLAFCNAALTAALNTEQTSLLSWKKPKIQHDSQQDHITEWSTSAASTWEFNMFHELQLDVKLHELYN